MMDWECDDFGVCVRMDDSGKVDDFANVWVVDDSVRDCDYDCRCGYGCVDVHVLQIPID